MNNHEDGYVDHVCHTGMTISLKLARLAPVICLMRLFFSETSRLIRLIHSLHVPFPVRFVWSWKCLLNLCPVDPRRIIPSTADLMTQKLRGDTRTH